MLRTAEGDKKRKSKDVQADGTAYSSKKMNEFRFTGEDVSPRPPLPRKGLCEEERHPSGGKKNGGEGPYLCCCVNLKLENRLQSKPQRSSV